MGGVIELIMPLMYYGTPSCATEKSTGMSGGIIDDSTFGQFNAERVLNVLLYCFNDTPRTVDAVLGLCFV